MKLYYVYILYRPDKGQTPCYVGKGSGDRYKCHARKGEKHKNIRLANIFRRANKLGLEVKSEIVFETYDEQEALLKEIELIAFYGRRTLCNYTDGGDSPKLTKATRAKISASRQGMRLSEEHKANISLGLLNSTKERVVKYVYTEEHKAKIGAAARGRPMTQENKEYVKQRMLKQMSDPEWKDNWLMNMKEAQNRPAVREKHSKRMLGNTLSLGVKCSEETKEKLRQSKLGKPRSMEVRQRISEGRLKANLLRREVAEEKAS